MANNSVTFELIRSIEVGNQIGENIIWDERRQQWWWTDALGKTLFTLKLGHTEQQDELTRWSLPENICSFGFVKDSEDLIVAFESGLAFYNVQTEQLKWIEKIETDREHTAMNDGRIDRNGRFWCGGVVLVLKREPECRGTGLYSVNSECKVEQHLDGLLSSNALCWSPDGNIMYHADTALRQIYRYAFDQQSGSLSDKQLLVETHPDMYPDGAVVDAEGFVWSAQWGGRGVVRYNPNGEEDTVLPMPVSQVTCVGFGGPQLDWLCVTTAAVGLSPEALEKEPLAGSLFIYKTNRQGIAECSFVGRPVVEDAEEAQDDE